MSSPLSELFDDLSDGLVLLCRDRAVRYANRAARERFGIVQGNALRPAVRDTVLRWRDRGYVSQATMVSLPMPRPACPDERMLVSVFDGLLDGELALLVRAARSPSQLQVHLEAESARLARRVLGEISARTAGC